MRFILFFIGLMVLALMMGLFKDFSADGETIMSALPVEEWMILVWKLLPIAIPVGVVIMGIIYIAKGSRKRNIEE